MSFGAEAMKESCHRPIDVGTKVASTLCSK